MNAWVRGRETAVTDLLLKWQLIWVKFTFYLLSPVRSTYQEHKNHTCGPLVV